MSGIMGQKKTKPISKENKMNTINYTISAISCGHCKMTIEKEVGELPGVASVNVDVDTQSAIIEFGLPTTETEIKALLDEIGYPPKL